MLESYLNFDNFLFYPECYIFVIYPSRSRHSFALLGSIPYLAFFLPPFLPSIN